MISAILKFIYSFSWFILISCTLSPQILVFKRFDICTLLEKCAYLELFWSVFSRIRTKYREMLQISPYSVRVPKNTDQNNSEYGHFLRSVDNEQIFLFWRYYLVPQKLSLHKKWSFPLRICSVNVTSSSEILNGKLCFFVQYFIYIFHKINPKNFKQILKPYTISVQK